MKYHIKLATFVLFFIIPSLVLCEFYETQLKSAALENGYKSPELVNGFFENKKAKLGEIFFNSKKLSFNGDTSCGSCHLDKFSSADGLPNAVGVGGTGKGPHRMLGTGALVPRNTLPLWGRASTDFSTFFWDGKVSRQDGILNSQFGTQAPSTDPLIVALHLPFVEIREMIVDDKFVSKNLKTETVDSAKIIQVELLKRVEEDLGLAEQLASAYSIKPSELEFIHIIDPIKHFFAKKFALKPSRFSQFITQNFSLSKDEVAGGLIFYGKGMCSACHSGPHFSDFKFHTILYPQVGPGKNGFGSDYGRYNFTLDYRDLNKFRTPPLHNVEKTGPYGHSGSIYDLKGAIIGHYDPFSLYEFDKMTRIQRREVFQKMVGISNLQPVPSSLTDKELSDLIEFLKTLSFD